MIILSDSLLTVPLPVGLFARLNVSSEMMNLEPHQGHLIFLNASLLHVLIDGHNSLNALRTKAISQSIRSQDRSCVGHVAYVKANGDILNTVNPVSELAAISMLGVEYLPAFVNFEALQVFKRLHFAKIFENLPNGWQLSEKTQCKVLV